MQSMKEILRLTASDGCAKEEPMEEQPSDKNGEMSDAELVRELRTAALYHSFQNPAIAARTAFSMAADRIERLSAVPPVDADFAEIAALKEQLAEAQRELVELHKEWEQDLKDAAGLSAPSSTAPNYIDPTIRKGWTVERSPDAISCHSCVVDGVLCRWWGEDVPPGVALIDAALSSATLPTIEIRNNPDGSLDEAILADGKAHFHLEQMDTGHWWMALSLDRHRIDIGLHSKGKIKANVSDEGEVPILGATTDGGSAG